MLCFIAPEFCWLNNSTKCNFISLCWHRIKIIFLTLHLKWTHGVGLFCNFLPCCLYIASFIFFPLENTQILFWEIISTVGVQRDLRITLTVAWEASSQGYLQGLSQKATVEWKGLRIFVIWGVTEMHTDDVESCSLLFCRQFEISAVFIHIQWCSFSRLQHSVKRLFS